MTKHTIIIGDSRKMEEVKDETVHLVITSPPYWQLKDYQDKRQIGFDHSYEDYINNLNLVWQECYRILHKGCRLCINIGDQFARSVYYGRYKIIPIRTEIIKFCETIGFDYMGAIIWQKVTTMNTTGGATVMGSYPYPRNGIIKLDYEFILIFKKLGKAPKVDKETKEKSRMTNEEWNAYFNGHWNFPGERQDKHLAMFPEELPRRLIKMFSFVGDTVLDPFLGSGTTSLAAKNLERNSIGYEINPDFLPVITEKMGIAQQTLFDETGFEVIIQKSMGKDFRDEISKLPYKFVDPVQFDKKVNVKKMTFGSKIDAESKERENYMVVEEVTAPNALVLTGGLKIKLLGVKPKAGFDEYAMDYLLKNVKGKKIFLRRDDEKNTSNKFYVYLKNKTFVNAHLIKKGLADIDDSFSFKKLQRFKKYWSDTNGKRMDT